MATDETKLYEEFYDKLVEDLKDEIDALENVNKTQLETMKDRRGLNAFNLKEYKKNDRKLRYKKTALGNAVKNIKKR